MKSGQTQTVKVSYWVEQWAGSSVGHVVVTIEYPNLASLARSEAMTQASPEMHQWQADAQASGLKEISASLVSELRP